MSLSGALLVVDDGSGARIAFSYPVADRSAASDGIARMLRPKATLCNQPVVVTIDDTTFVTYPVACGSQKCGSTVIEEQASTFQCEDPLGWGIESPCHGSSDSAVVSPERIPFFNVALVLTGGDDDRNTKDKLSAVLERDVLVASVRDAVTRIASCFRYEEERDMYVTREAATLLSLLPRDGSTTSSGTSAINTDVELLKTIRSTVCHALPPTFDTILSDKQPAGLLASHPALGVSSLARELFTIYHCLAPGVGATAHVRFNSWVSASLSLSPAAAYGLHSVEQIEEGAAADEALGVSGVPLASVRSARHGFAPDGGIAAAGREMQARPSPQANLQPIRPYHTLLLLKEPKDILTALPSDASPQLAQLLEVASPLRSFHELQGETGIASSQLLRLAGHLVHWGLAVITNVVTTHSVYTPAPGVDFSPSSACVTEFEELFGGSNHAAAASGDDNNARLTLASVMALFSKTTAVTSVAGPAEPGANTEAQVTDAGASGPESPVLLLPVGSGLPLRTLMGSMQAQSQTYNRFLQALCWLLKRGYLRQMHVNVYLLWPFSLDPDEQQAASHTGPGVIPWSQDELVFLAGLCRKSSVAADAGRVRLFRRLVAYLRDVSALMAAADWNGGDSSQQLSSSDDGGRVPPALQLGIRLEEIMWRLRVSRREIQQVIDAFPEVLAISIHE